MSWVGPLISAIGSIAGGAMGASGAKDSARAQARAQQQALELQRQIYNSGIQMQEPWRATGQGALNALARLYGLPYYDYNPAQQIGGQGFGGQGFGGQGSSGFPGAPKTNVAGQSTEGGFYDMLRKQEQFSPPELIAGKLGLPTPASALNSLFGGGPKPYWQNKDGTITFNGAEGGKKFWGGIIDPRTGEVKVNNDPDGSVSAALTEYLRTGQGDLGSQGNRFVKAVNALRGTGWQHNAGQQVNPETGMPAGYHEGTGQADMSVFTASPDYQFRRDEGTRGIERSAAARGGAMSGNALRALTDFNSNLASSEFGNFYNRMANMAGMGQVATNNAVGSGQYFGQQAGNTLGNIGNARASGIAGAANMWGQGISGAANVFGNWWENRNNPYVSPYSRRS